MRRLPPRLRRAPAALVLTALATVVFGAHAGAAEAPAGRRGIDVVQVEGLIDPPNADLIRDSIARAERRGSTVVVFQLDASGAVGVDVDGLVARMRAARVPTVVWVGPSGADARGAAGLLALAASRVVVSQGSGIGALRPVRLDHPDRPDRPTLVRAVAARLRAAEDPGRAAAAVVDRRLSAVDAKRLGVIDDVEPTVGDLVVSLDGETLPTAAGPKTISTAHVVQTDKGPRREPNQDVHFAKLSLPAELRHTLGAPWVAYLLFVAGLCLLVFEFYTASIGLAGAVGAVALAGAVFGFGVLPVEWWAALLLAIGVLGLTVDVQAGGVGVWTAIGSTALVAGSVTLYGGSSRLDPAWWVVVLVCGGTGIFMLGAMPAMIRSRFSTPTIGREGIVGEMGTAEVDVSPDGVVRVRGALWRARTNRATPIRSGEPVRVVAVEGITLEVEPEEGGARDYRERARRS
jgi:membrane-bound serine protease (ClpP class)